MPRILDNPPLLEELASEDAVLTSPEESELIVAELENPLKEDTLSYNGLPIPIILLSLIA